MQKGSKKVGYIDSLNYVDRLATDFSPKTKGTAFRDYGFAPNIKGTAFKEYGFGIPTIKVGSPMFEPFPRTAENRFKRIMHVGPAPSKQLNKKQISELVHELKENKYKSAGIKKDVKEIVGLSRKYMNSPWDSVPGKYRSKYSNLDFDGDGVPNSWDCKPFDYNRQTNYKISGGKIVPVTSAPAKTSTTTKTTTSTPAKTTSSSSGSTKTSSVQYVTDGLGRTVVNEAYTAPKTTTTSSGSSNNSQALLNYITPSTPTSSSSSKSSSSSNNSQGLIQYVTPGIIPAANPYFSTGLSGGSSKSSGTYDVYTGTYTDPDGNKMSMAPDKVPGDTVKIDPDIAIKIKTQTSDESWDQAGLQKLYEDLLAGKITDPAYAAEIEKQFAPYKAQYEAKAKQLQSLSNRNAYLQASRQARYSKMASILGGDSSTEWLNQKNRARASEIYNSRTAAFTAKLNKDLETAGTALNDTGLNLQKQAQEAASNKAKAEAEARKNEFYKAAKFSESNQTIKASELDAFKLKNPNAAIQVVG